VVHLVQVDVIGLEPPEARLARAPDVIGGQPAVVRTEPHRLVHLGGQDDPVAASASLQPPADGLLRDAVPLLHVRRLRPAVDVGGVEEVDARVERRVHDSEAGRLVDEVPEVHGPEADPADQQTRAAQVPVRHLVAHAASIRIGLLAWMRRQRSPPG
jgi:hypothetical protein